MWFWAILGLIIALFIWAYRGSIKQDEIYKAEFESKYQDELQKPMYKIAFKTKFDNETRYTNSIKPRKIGDGSGMSMSWIGTSYERAERLLSLSYERGYFKDSEGITYPACNIVRAEVVEE